MAARRSKKSNKLTKAQKEALKAIGEELLPAMRRLYHYSCQFETNLERGSALVSSQLFVTGLSMALDVVIRQELGDKVADMTQEPSTEVQATIIGFLDANLMDHGKVVEFTFPQFGHANA